MLYSMWQADDTLSPRYCRTLTLPLILYMRSKIDKTAMLLLQDRFSSTQAGVVVATICGGRHGDPEVEKLKTRWIL